MKIWKISCCADCPKIMLDYMIKGKNHCYTENKQINNINTLPKWCPLEDFHFNPTYIKE